MLHLAGAEATITKQMKKYILLAVILGAGYFVTGCANDGDSGNTAGATGNPSAGAADTVSGPGGTGPIEHGGGSTGNGGHGGH